MLNQVVVAFGDDARTKRVVAAAQQAGHCWCGGTGWHDQEAIRISASFWATTSRDTAAMLDSLLDAFRLYG